MRLVRLNNSHAPFMLPPASSCSKFMLACRLCVKRCGVVQRGTERPSEAHHHVGVRSCVWRTCLVGSRKPTMSTSLQLLTRITCRSPRGSSKLHKPTACHLEDKSSTRNVGTIRETKHASPRTKDVLHILWRGCVLAHMLPSLGICEACTPRD